MKIKCVLSDDPEFTIELLEEGKLETGIDYVITYEKTKCSYWGVPLDDILNMTILSTFRVSENRVPRDPNIAHIKRTVGVDALGRGRTYKIRELERQDEIYLEKG